MNAEMFILHKVSQGASVLISGEDRHACRAFFLRCVGATHGMVNLLTYTGHDREQICDIFPYRNVLCLHKLSKKSEDGICGLISDYSKSYNSFISSIKEHNEQVLICTDTSKEGEVLFLKTNGLPPVDYSVVLNKYHHDNKLIKSVLEFNSEHPSGKFVTDFDLERTVL